MGRGSAAMIVKALVFWYERAIILEAKLALLEKEKGQEEERETASLRHRQ